MNCFDILKNKFLIKTSHQFCLRSVSIFQFWAAESNFCVDERRVREHSSLYCDLPIRCTPEHPVSCLATVGVLGNGCNKRPLLMHTSISPVLLQSEEESHVSA